MTNRTTVISLPPSLWGMSHCEGYALYLPLWPPKTDYHKPLITLKNLKHIRGLLTTEKLFLVFKSKVEDSLYLVQGRKPYYFINICALSVFCYYPFYLKNTFNASWLSQVLMIRTLLLLKFLNTLLEP